MNKLLIIGAAMVAMAGVGAVMAREAANAARRPQGLEACMSARARTGLRDALLTRIAARGGEIDAGYALSLDTPRLESIDYTAERTVCGGVARLSVPEHRRAALDGVSELSDPVRYMIEPSADGRGTVVALVGGGDTIAGWLGGPPPPPAPPVLLQADYGPAQPAGGEATPEVGPTPAPQPAVVRTPAPVLAAPARPVASRQVAAQPAPRLVTPQPTPRTQPIRVVSNAPPATGLSPTRPAPPATPHRTPSIATARLNNRPASPNPVPAPEAQNPAPSVAAVRATARPSFDCRQARNNAERSICSDPGLADLDVQMARRYARMQNNIDGRPAEILRDEQRAWLRRRDACATNACIRALYETRAATMGR